MLSVYFGLSLVSLLITGFPWRLSFPWSSLFLILLKINTHGVHLIESIVSSSGILQTRLLPGFWIPTNPVFQFLYHTWPSWYKNWKNNCHHKCKSKSRRRHVRHNLMYYRSPRLVCVSKTVLRYLYRPSLVPPLYSHSPWGFPTVKLFFRDVPTV